ncbi:crossover junction endodeoxyribonuclease RuvC [candidate division Kazan bacterium RIFCSPLOWO2_01_FULL_48_13]|uniref:Crossover junction endodeoxyribonuclease RuvC n=1 Tax=candidate division Kazan bacterium RIFCSPLOWO2_01_FULL_48_13 TaxID=1798539 RepID=A0A1F4PN99_UNCK3|nr:MAG: crossover junction endodeoxyribonuclease RuvC [candidate division Kazan bacterium RIFCSPLOWO2_01_FULL_48_13]
MSRIILGLDPGTATTGFGVVKEDQGSIALVDCGYITTPSTNSDSDRLLVIGRAVEKLLKTYRPDAVAVEKLFFAKNQTTAMAVSQSRGVLLASIARAQLPLLEYTPLQVKQRITGYGRADKRQIQQMVKALLKLDQVPQPDDAADALAVAICGAAEKPPNATIGI